MDAELLRGLLNEIAGDCRVAYGVTEESYRAYCRNGAMGTFPADTWAVHCQRRLGQIEQALASLSVAQGQGLTGEVVELGDDETGQPRILIHTTREAIKAHAQNLMFRTVVVAAAPAQPDGVE